MKKLLLIALLTVSTAAYAADATAPAATTAPAARTAAHEQKFEARKAEKLQHISMHLTKAQKEVSCLTQVQSCVQASTNGKALEACHVEREECHLGN